MSQKRHSVDQIIAKLRRADVLLGKDTKVPEICKQLEIAEQTYYRWRQKYGGMQPEMAKQLKTLEKENARLKKMVAEQALDMDIVKEAAKGNWEAPNDDGEQSPSSLGATEGVGASRLPRARSTSRYTALSATSAA